MTVTLHGEVKGLSLSLPQSFVSERDTKKLQKTALRLRECRALTNITCSTFITNLQIFDKVVITFQRAEIYALLKPEKSLLMPM